MKVSHRDGSSGTHPGSVISLLSRSRPLRGLSQLVSIPKVECRILRIGFSFETPQQHSRFRPTSAQLGKPLAHRVTHYIYIWLAWSECGLRDQSRSILPAPLTGKGIGLREATLGASLLRVLIFFVPLPLYFESGAFRGGPLLFRVRVPQKR